MNLKQTAISILIYFSLTNVSLADSYIDPRLSSETNTAITYSIARKANDALKVKNKTTNLAVLLTEDILIEKSSHEYAHFREGLRGGRFDMSFNLINPVQSVFDFKYNPKPESLSSFYSAGLNQNELNAYNIYSNCKNTINIDDAVHFLVAKTWDSAYCLTVNTTYDDITQYSNYAGLKKRTIRTSILATDILNPCVWNSLKCITNYLNTGTEETRKSTLPYTSHYMLPKGSLFDIRYTNKDIEYNVEFGAATRAGIKACNENKINPFLYFGEGISTGLEYKTKDCFARIEYNNNDPLENKVKNKPKGLNITLEMEKRF